MKYSIFGLICPPQVFNPVLFLVFGQMALISRTKTDDIYSECAAPASLQQKKRQAAFSAMVVPFVGHRVATIGRRSQRRRHPINHTVMFQRSIVMLLYSHGGSSAFVSGGVRLNSRSPLF